MNEIINWVSSLNAGIISELECQLAESKYQRALFKYPFQQPNPNKAPFKKLLAPHLHLIYPWIQIFFLFFLNSNANNTSKQTSEVRHD